MVQAFDYTYVTYVIFTTYILTKEVDISVFKCLFAYRKIICRQNSKTIWNWISSKSFEFAFNWGQTTPITSFGERVYHFWSFLGPFLVFLAFFGLNHHLRSVDCFLLHSRWHKWWIPIKNEWKINLQSKFFWLVLKVNTWYGYDSTFIFQLKMA